MSLIQVVSNFQKLKVSKHDARGYMQVNAKWLLVSAEIHLGMCTVMEYLLSPVSKTLHEAGREL